MSEATPRPWQWSDRNPRNEVDPFNRHITGKHYEDEDGCDICTSVAIVRGNASSGDIQDTNARLIVRAVNAHDDLVAACEMVLQRWTFDNNQQHTHSWHDMQDCAEVIRAALAKAGET